MKTDKVIIIGAPRSGTNLLRDTLCKLPNLTTWPCDEINYIWRYGNLLHQSDDFTNNPVSKKTKEYVNKKFKEIKKKNKADVVIEKTCANSLRLGYVNKVVPDAKYIFIHRNGFDSVASATYRWKSRINFKYIFQKARFVPIIHIPFYAFRYFWSTLFRLFSKDKRYKFWGPVIDNQEVVMKGKSLLQICAIQWKSCIENTLRDIKNLDDDRYIKINYEDFVTNPELELEKIFKFIDVEYDKNCLPQITNDVSSKNINKGVNSFNNIDTHEIAEIIKDPMTKLGYKI